MFVLHRWTWTYRLVRIDARAGPHKGIAAYPRLNRTPLPTSRLEVFSMVRSVQRIWSSVMIHKTLSTTTAQYPCLDCRQQRR